MQPHQFTNYTLRTTDVEAARAFYDAVLGPAVADIVPLHEQALKRGAVPHWLGTIRVDEVDAKATELATLGCERLGPTMASNGRSFASLRDPGGAVFGLSSHATPSRAKVVWHFLSTRDVDASAGVYQRVFGWQRTGSSALGSVEYHNFAWAAGQTDVGSMSSTSGRMGVHPHWLFQMQVPAFDVAVSTAKANGATFAAIIDTDGMRIAIGDDPQGAAFSLRS